MAVNTVFHYFWTTHLTVISSEICILACVQVNYMSLVGGATVKDFVSLNNG